MRMSEFLIDRRVHGSRECACVVVEINNTYPSTNWAFFSSYRLCSAALGLEKPSPFQFGDKRWWRFGPWFQVTNHLIGILADEREKKVQTRRA